MTGAFHYAPTLADLDGDGALDLVVNNAGLSISKPLLETTERDWDLQHDVMAKGSFLVSRAAARVLIEQGMGGDIVYVSSKNSVFAVPNNVAYAAAKADQAHQVRLLAAAPGRVWLTARMGYGPADARRLDRLADLAAETGARVLAVHKLGYHHPQTPPPPGATRSTAVP